MYFGVSKRIGRGLRIGTAINTKNWDKDEGDGLTAADRVAFLFEG